jgi:hypothetical protein
MSRNSENDSGGFHLQLTQPMELSLLASTAEEKQSNGLKFSIDFARCKQSGSLMLSQLLAVATLSNSMMNSLR